jgi:hypothetical protein
MTAVIDVQSMHQSYGGTVAVDDVSFSWPDLMEDISRGHEPSRRRR